MYFVPPPLDAVTWNIAQPTIRPLSSTIGTGKSWPMPYRARSEYNVVCEPALSGEILSFSVVSVDNPPFWMSPLITLESPLHMSQYMVQLNVLASCGTSCEPGGGSAYVASLPMPAPFASKAL